MSDQDNKMKLGFDTTDAAKGEQELIKIFNNLNKGMQAFGVESAHYSKEGGQLVLATLRATTDEGRKVVAQLREAEGAIVAFDKAGKLRFGAGSKVGNPGTLIGPKSISDAFVSTGYTYTDKNDDPTIMAEAQSKKLATIMQKRDLEMYQIENKRLADMQAAASKQIAIEQKRDLEMNRLAGKEYQDEQTKTIKLVEIQQKRDLELNQIAGKKYKMDWNEAIAEDKQRSAPTYFDKLFNQAAAITTGIVISQIFMGITTEIANSVKQAAELEVRLSEIRTISRDSAKSFEQWGETVRNISDKFGKDTKDTTEGIYQALSSQVVKGENIDPFMDTAGKFSAATVSSTTNSVNLLAAAINSYGKSAAEADVVAGQLFKMIELGHMRVDEIHDSMGGLFSVTSKMGLSLSEVGAALTAMTRQGVAPANAITYLTNIMNSMLKPAPNMVKVLNSWGVSSGEAAFNLKGLTGVLKGMNAEVEKGGLEQIAGDVKNIRSIKGFSLLTGSGLDKYNEDLKGFASSSTTYVEKVAIAFESSGKKLEIEAQKLKDIFLFDFGIPVVNTFVKVTESFGGLTNIVTVSSKVLSAIFVTRIPAAIGATITSLRALSATMLLNPWTALATAVAAAVVYLVLFRKTNDDVVKESIIKAKELSDKWNEAVVERNAKIEEETKGSMDAQYQIIYGTLANIRIAYSDLSTKIGEEYKKVDSHLKESVDSFKDKFGEALKITEERFNSLKTHIKSMKQDMLSFNEKRDTHDFENTIEDYSKARKAAAEMEYSQKLSAKATLEQANAVKLLSQGDIEGSHEAYAKARNYYDEAINFSDRAQKNAKGDKKDESKDITKAIKDWKKVQEQLDASRNGQLSGKSFDPAKYQTLVNKYQEAKQHIIDIQTSQKDNQNQLLNSSDLEAKAVKQQRDLHAEINNMIEKQIKLETDKASIEKKKLDEGRSLRKSLGEQLTDASHVEYKKGDTETDITLKLSKIERAEQAFKKAQEEHPEIASFTEGLNIINDLKTKHDLLKGIIDTKKQEKDIDEKQHNMMKIQKQDQEQLNKAIANKTLAEKAVGTLGAQTEVIFSKLGKGTTDPADVAISKVAEYSKLLNNEQDPKTKQEYLVQLIKNMQEYKAELAKHQNYFNATDNTIGQHPRTKELTEKTEGKDFNVISVVEELKNAKDTLQDSSTKLAEVSTNIRIHKEQVENLSSVYEQTFGKITSDITKSNDDIQKSYEKMINEIKNKIPELLEFQKKFNTGDNQDVLNDEVGNNDFKKNYIYNNGQKPDVTNKTSNNSTTIGDIVVNVNNNNQPISPRQLALEIRREFLRGTVPSINA